METVAVFRAKLQTCPNFPVTCFMVFQSFKVASSLKPPTVYQRASPALTADCSPPSPAVGGRSCGVVRAACARYMETCGGLFADVPPPPVAQSKCAAAPDQPTCFQVNRVSSN